jgi:hypothetical protein
MNRNIPDTFSPYEVITKTLDFLGFPACKNIHPQKPAVYQNTDYVFFMLSKKYYFHNMLIICGLYGIIGITRHIINELLINFIAF